MTTTAAGRLALQFVAVNDDLAVGPFTGMTGGIWVEAVAEFASATGTDGCIQLQIGGAAVASLGAATACDNIFGNVRASRTDRHSRNRSLAPAPKRSPSHSC